MKTPGLCAELSVAGVALQGGAMPPLWIEGAPMEALASALMSRARSRWQARMPLSVTFCFPFARDAMVPWPGEVRHVKDYQSCLAHAFPSMNGQANAWRAGFELPCRGASAFAWAVPEADYQTVLTLCQHARMRLDAVHTPLSFALAKHRKRLPEQAALLALDSAYLHCAVLRQHCVQHVFTWPLSPGHALKASLDLASALANVDLPAGVFVAGERPDASSMWDGVEWLESDQSERMA